ncbi:MAG: class I mannose-6-phosphate isomerase [Treponema sp.]|nr:class I mannose-6-phosphate isomerase [Treponema sp.]
MLKLDPVESKKIWGYELWLASTHKNGLQKAFAEKCGDFPLLVKIIQADDILSVQVHPDDESARELEGKDERGKTECWYVLDANEQSQIVYGLKKNVSREELKKAVEENQLEQYLNFVKVKKGDFVFIPSTTVHAIGKGLRLLEVQQSCDLTYRFYDWGRGREVHLEKALKVMSSKTMPTIQQFSGSFECDYFSLEQINVCGGWSMYCSGSNASKDTQLLFVLEENHAVIKSPDEKIPTALKSEDIYAVFPGEKITVEGKARIMRIRAK